MRDRMFKDRTVGFWLGIAAAVIAIVSAIVFISVDVGDRTFSTAGFVLMLIGGISEIAVMLFDYKFMPVIPAVFYILGFSFTINAAIPALSDVWNNVNFIGGNATVGMVFSSIFFVCAVLAVVMNFMTQRKGENEEKAVEDDTTQDSAN